MDGKRVRKQNKEEEEQYTLIDRGIKGDRDFKKITMEN